MPGTRTPGSRMGPQPQLDRTLAVKSRWGGDEGPAHPNAAYLWQIPHREMVRVDGASVWEAHLSRPRRTYSSVSHTHTHTHTLLICQLSHSELPTPLWVKSKHQRQIPGSMPGTTSFWLLPGLLFPTQFRWWILHMEPRWSLKTQTCSGHSLYCLYPPMAPLCLLRRPNPTVWLLLVQISSS